jgi:Protein of unknown function (DUF2569)
VKTDLEPAGIGGWLILPAIGLVISPIWQGIGIIRDIVPALNPDVLKTLSDPTSANYSALWVPTMIFESITSVLMFVFTLWLAYLFFFRKSALVPRLFIIWLASHLIIQIIDWLLTNRLPLAVEQSPNGIVSSLGRSITNAAIWIPYFIWSIRVKNTFVDTAAA